MKKLSSIKIILIYIIILICILSFIFIISSIQNNRAGEFDNYIYSLITSLKSDFMTNMFKSITSLCSVVFMVVLSLILFFVIKNKNYPITLALNLIGVVVINKIAKYIFSRQRPIGLHLIEESGYSFPSRAFNDKSCFLWLCYIFNIQKHK